MLLVVKLVQQQDMELLVQVYLEAKQQIQVDCLAAPQQQVLEDLVVTLLFLNCFTEDNSNVVMFHLRSIFIIASLYVPSNQPFVDAFYQLQIHNFIKFSNHTSTSKCANNVVDLQCSCVTIDNNTKFDEHVSLGYAKR